MTIHRQARSQAVAQRSISHRENAHVSHTLNSTRSTSCPIDVFTSSQIFPFFIGPKHFVEVSGTARQLEPRTALVVPPGTGTSTGTAVACCCFIIIPAAALRFRCFDDDRHKSCSLGKLEVQTKLVPAVHSPLRSLSSASGQRVQRVDRLAGIGFPGPPTSVRWRFIF